MKYIHLLFSTTFILFSHFVLAQETSSKWSNTEFYIQNRFFHQPENNTAQFNTNLDIGVGASKKYSLSQNFRLEMGLALNYGRFKNTSFNEEGTLFISYFKRTDMHYFEHQSVDQFTLEIPIGFQLNLFENNSNSISFTGGAVPQIRLYTAHKGLRFNEPTIINENLLNPDTPYLTDLYLRSGVSYLIIEKGINIGTGLEYSILGKSFGAYTKLGFQF